MRASVSLSLYTDCSLQTGNINICPAGRMTSVTWTSRWPADLTSQSPCRCQVTFIVNNSTSQAIIEVQILELQQFAV